MYFFFSEIVSLFICLCGRIYSYVVNWVLQVCARKKKETKKQRKNTTKKNADRPFEHLNDFLFNVVFSCRNSVLTGNKLVVFSNVNHNHNGVYDLNKNVYCLKIMESWSQQGVIMYCIWGCCVWPLHFYIFVFECKESALFEIFFLFYHLFDIRKRH